MKIDKPLVSILLAMYKPNEKWLVEQLESLNAQSYSAIEIIIWDDCPAEPVDKTLIARCLTNFSYTLIVGEKNLGSNGAFEELTKLAKGKYVSYCDQDDVWNHDKVAIMVERLERTDSPLVCSDLYIIDENSKRVADSITDIRKRHVFREGEGLAKGLLVNNFVTGCAMMMKTTIAQQAIPFLTSLVHDHWLTIIASLHGDIEFIVEPLIGYRQHGGNQTSILNGVFNKEDYYQCRMLQKLKTVEFYKVRLAEFVALNQVILDYETWLLARKEYYLNRTFTDLKVMIRYRDFGKVSILIETILPLLPEKIFSIIIKLAKRVKYNESERKL